MYQLVVLIIVSWLTYLGLLVVYRLYFSPIAGFPGPKLAAISRWYEFYYEVVLRGKFTFHIQDLHRKYGPIVRINHEELHISDSEYWETLYGPGRVDKYPYFQNRQNIPRSIFATSDFSLHRRRRAPLNPLFSKKRILDFQPVIQQKLALLCSKISQYVPNQRPFAINRAMTAFSGDVITEYVFGRSYEHLQSPDFKETFHEPFMAASEAGHMTLQFKFLFPVVNALPDSMVVRMQPLLYLIIKLRRDFDTKLKTIVAGEEKDNSEHPTILFEMLKSDLPAQDKKIDRLNEEAQLLVAAGLETAAWAMSVAIYHLVANRRVGDKLRDELVKAFPDKDATISWQEAETLPYLFGCVREGVRLSYGVTARSPRLWPKPLLYKDWIIPPHTPVSATVVDHNHNEEIFPNSFEFRPERWLEPDMDKWFFSFGKGSRACLGINLAHAEMYLCIATLFRRFQFELYETDESDVLLEHDFFLPSAKLSSRGIRVTTKIADK